MTKASKEERKKAQKKVDYAEKHSKLGSGKRFKAVAAAAKASGARDPDAVAAAIERKKYGKKKMAKMAAAGHKRH